MLTEGIIGVLGSVLGALSSWIAIKRAIHAPLEQLQEKVDRLEREKIQSLSAEMSRHISDDKSQRILALLEGIQANMSAMGVKLDRLCEATARHDAQIEANRQYISNLDAAVQHMQHKE